MKTGATLQRETVRGAPRATERVNVRVARELAWKMRRKLDGGKNNPQKRLDGSLDLVHCWRRQECREPMPNAHSPDKEPLSLQIPRTLMGRLKRKARQLEMSLPNYIIAILTNETRSITLTSKDYEAIARATAEAERTRRRCATRFDGAA